MTLLLCDNKIKCNNENKYVSMWKFRSKAIAHRRRHVK